MADESQVEVKFGADASGVQAGAQEVKSQLGGLESAVQALSSAMQAQANAIKEGFAKMAEASERTRKQVKEDAEEEEGALKRVALGVHEGLESFNKFKAGLAEIAEVYMAAFAVERVHEWAEHMGEAAEKVEHLSQRFGMSVADVQQLGAAATLSGGNIDMMTAAMSRLDLTVQKAKDGSKQAQAVLAEVGLSASGSYTNVEMLSKIMEHFGEMADGPAKAALAMELFGRAGAQLIPFLNEGAEGAERLKEVMEKYGVQNEAAVESGAKLGEAFNENKVAMSGLSNVLTEAFAPALTVLVEGMNDLIASWIKSYKEGGAVKQVADFIAEAFKALVAVAVFLGVSIDVAVKTIVAGFTIAKAGAELWADDTSAKVRQVINIFVTFGETAFEVMQHDFMGAVRVFQAGMNHMRDVARQDTQAIIADLQKMAKAKADAAATMASAGNDWKAAQGFVDKLSSNETHTAAPRPRGTTGDMEGHGKDPKETKAKDDLIQQLQEKLNEKEQTEAEQSGEYLKDRTAEELQFWTDALALTTRGSKDWLTIKAKMFEEERKLHEQNLQDTLAALDRQIQAATGNAAEQERLEQKKVDAIRANYGDGSRAMNEELTKQLEMIRKHQQEAAALVVKGIESQTKATLDGMRAQAEAMKASFAEQEGWIDFRAKFGVLTEQAALQQKLAIHQREAASAIAALQAQIDAVRAAAAEELSVANLTEKEKEAIINRERDAEAKLQADIVKLNAQAHTTLVADERAKLSQQLTLWQGYVNTMVTSFTSGIQGMIQGTMTFQQAIAQMGTAILNIFVSVVEKMVERWLMGMITNMIGTKAESSIQSLGQIQDAAAVGYANAFASTAAIPVVGPELAPGVAAATMASIEAASGLVGAGFAAAGGFDIPTGLNPVTQLHQEEMVLPASLANPLRAMLGAGQSGPDAAQSKGGDTHVHIHATDAQSVKRLLMDNRGALSDALRRELRDMRLAA